MARYAGYSVVIESSAWIKWQGQCFLFCLKEQCNLRDLVKKKKSVTIFEACKYLKYSSKINVFLRNNKLQICSIILMYAFWYRGMSSGTWLLCAFNFLMGIGIHIFFFLQLEIVIVPLIWYLTNSIFYTLKLWQKLCHFAKQVQASSTLSVSYGAMAKQVFSSHICVRKVSSRQQCFFLFCTRYAQIKFSK